MKRLLLATLAVMLLASSARADGYYVTLWLEDKADGDGHLLIEGVSNTGVIQLWMEVPAEMRLINIAAILLGYDYDGEYGKDLSFEVAGFTDVVIPDSNLQRTTRGPIEDDLPNGFMDDYQYVGEDANFPMGGESGVLGPRTILLDEIFIHSTGINQGTPDLIMMFGSCVGDGFELVFQPLPPPGQWIISPIYADMLNDLGNPFLVETVPEPTALSLLVLAGLAIARRRGSRGW